jgi:hypothetical protein
VTRLSLLEFFLSLEYLFLSIRSVPSSTTTAALFKRIGVCSLSSAYAAKQMFAVMFIDRAREDKSSADLRRQTRCICGSLENMPSAVPNTEMRLVNCITAATLTQGGHVLFFKFFCVALLGAGTL